MRELSLNVMDVAQNSISAGARLIEISVAKGAGSLVITIRDDGGGMAPEILEKVADPFYTTRSTRSVGLGVPLFKMAAEMTGGSFAIESEPGRGTTVTARFVPSHIDMMPLGDMNETVLLLITCNPDIDFVYESRSGGSCFTLDTRELREALGGEVSLADPEVVAWIRDYLAEQA